MSTETSNILFYGYGNPGRGDDGLGPALVAELEPLASAGLACESDYQLSVEDAATLAGYDVVVFVDADMQGPGQVVALAAEMFGSQVKAYTLGIRGYQFGELCESLSDAARANLAAALAFAKHAVNEQHFDKYTKQFGVDSDRRPVCDPQPEA
jgi:hydrogenase maturation protease